MLEHSKRKSRPRPAALRVKGNISCRKCQCTAIGASSRNLAPSEHIHTRLLVSQPQYRVCVGRSDPQQEYSEMSAPPTPRQYSSISDALHQDCPTKTVPPIPPPADAALPASASTLAAAAFSSRCARLALDQTRTKPLLAATCTNTHNTLRLKPLHAPPHSENKCRGWF